MSKFSLILVASMGVSFNAFASKLVSTTKYSDGQVFVEEGIADDGFSSPTSICLEGSNLADVCSLAAIAEADSKEAYHNGHGFIEIKSCEVKVQDNYADLTYAQITDYDRGNDPNIVNFKVYPCGQ